MTLQTEHGIGHNSLSEHGLDEANVALLHSIYDDLLGMYTEPVDPGSLRAHERLVTQRNAAMKALVRLTRRSKNFDCGAAIVVIVAALSDNQYGRATISNPRLARALKRDPSAIERRINTLVEEGYLGRESQPGRASSTWVITSLVDAELKPNDIINKIDPEGQRRAQKAPAWDAGAVAHTPRMGRGGCRTAPPYSDAGGSSHAPRTEQAYPPHHLSEPPARGVAQPYENTREAGANTAIYNTAKKNSADYVDAASSTSRLRELDVGEFVRRFTAEDQCRPLLPWWEEIDQASLHSALTAGARLAETVPNIVAGLIALFPRAPARALAHAVREEISFREHCIQKLRDALVILEALPRDLLPSLSEAGRELKVGDELVRMLQAGRTLEAVLRARAEAAYLEGLRRAWSIDKGRELTNADVRQLPLGGSQMRLPAPPWPKSEAQLTTYIDRVEAEVQPAARHHTLGQLRGAWDYEREDAGLALSFELPPAHREELERRLNHWIEGSWDDMQPIYWPLIAPSPELEECVDD